jgi:hypothetical protein
LEELHAKIIMEDLLIDLEELHAQFLISKKAHKSYYEFRCALLVQILSLIVEGHFRRVVQFKKI